MKITSLIRRILLSVPAINTVSQYIIIIDKIKKIILNILSKIKRTFFSPIGYIIDYLF